MKKVVLSVVAALAVGGMAAPAFAADMPVKAKMAEPAPPPNPFDIAFGTAFTTDYEFRGLTQTDHKPAVQGTLELDYTAAPWLTLYAGLWGSNINWGAGSYAEFDITGGARFSYKQFGLDVGYDYYDYPNTTPNGSYGEFYAKPSFQITNWLTVGAAFWGGSNWANTGNTAWYYEGNATVTLPQFLPMGIGTSISGAVGRQTYDSTIHSTGVIDYTTWNVGVDFSYKAITLDLRYWDTNVDTTNAAQCVSGTGSGVDVCSATFVATLSFNTSLSALK